MRRPDERGIALLLAAARRAAADSALEEHAEDQLAEIAGVLTQLLQTVAHLVEPAVAKQIPDDDPVQNQQAQRADQPADERIVLADLAAMAETQFGDLVKAVVDVERGLMAVGGELHSDEEALLLEDGSAQRNLWGINLYPGIAGEDWLEFDSMVNIRPSQGNRSRGVDDAATRERIRAVVNRLVAR